MSEEGGAAEIGEGEDVTNSLSSMSEEGDVGEGKDVTNISSSMSEEGGAAKIGEGEDVTNSLSSMSEEGETGEGKDRLDVDALLEVESQIKGKHVGKSSSSMSFECEVQNDVDTEETDVGELLEEDKD